MRRKGGFTLIELIIVIVIVGILAVVAIPKYFANIKKAEKAQALSNLRAIREVMLAYSSANNGALPTVTPGTPITVTMDGEDVMQVTPPTGYGYTSPNVTSPAINGCTYSMNLQSGVPAVAGDGCPTTP